MSQIHSSNSAAQIRFAFDNDANDAIKSHVQSPFQTLKETIDKMVEANRNQSSPQIESLKKALNAMQHQFEMQFAQISIGMSTEKQDFLWELTALPF
jgi:ElaB/YqjD/DUF883 family membrane-anchored ribosome-binding protein